MLVRFSGKSKLLGKCAFQVWSAPMRLLRGCSGEKWCSADSDRSAARACLASRRWTMAPQTKRVRRTPLILKSKEHWNIVDHVHVLILSNAEIGTFSRLRSNARDRSPAGALPPFPWPAGKDKLPIDFRPNIGQAGAPRMSLIMWIRAQNRGAVA